MAEFPEFYGPSWIGTLYYSDVARIVCEAASADLSPASQDENRIHLLIDVLILAGEAKSHCVLETFADLVTEYADRPEFLRQIFVLEDCMSSIPHPEARFHEIATKQFAKFTAQGVNIINSTDPLPF